ncbi:galactan beta-1,4-galactosyltransferase GALS3 [Elaeis guineensis]|uniref:Glycosyltransferase family 92 protein n=1 Tax=Elaeis guineensis var. tenera TaxID=51953 RepID=A0A6I9RVB5_ELAGV|nr:galactan beta-1,4-galactosyltransferase GALS3 [Elaeis guineensis]
MVKDREKAGERNVLVGVVWNCADIKLLLTSLFFLGSLATIIQFLPSNLGLSSADLRSCLYSKFSSSFSSAASSSSSQAPPLNLSSSVPTPQALKHEEVTPDSVVKRAFNPVGSAAYLFVQMGAYRGGSNTFAVVGLASKPLHVFAKPRFTCEWAPHDNPGASVTAPAYKILPDWGYGRVYTVVVVNCTFPADVGADGSGGRLIVNATTGGGADRALDVEERFVALEEAPGSVNASIFSAPPKYDYLYCGSSLYGNLSPQRMREWMAYHVKLFGDKSHFVIHDAGGVHPGVMEVLRPWMEKGLVTLQDIREQERFDGYYHNQFLVVNDCLHRYRFMAKWMFFFDVDEFIYVQPKTTLQSVLALFSSYTQFTIEQMPMSNKLCLSSDAGKTPRMWGFEKLVYRDVKRGVRRDRKYAIQPRNVFATGVHMSQNIAGRSLHKTEGRIKYFHYHGTIADRRYPCKVFVNDTTLTFEGTPYVFDPTLRQLAGLVKRFELKTIGSRLQRTRQ